MDRHFCLDDSPWFQMLELDSVGSTNDFLRAFQPPVCRRITLATAEYQTAGRGSGSNTWESAPGENLLFSILTLPTWQQAAGMFALSEIIALAVSSALSEFLEGILIKWPNDIYQGDRKIAGMLIENVLKGSSVGRCIMGVGLNVNQTRFVSDAPNPVSMAQLLGKSVERRFVLEKVMEHFTHLYDRLERGEAEAIHKEYLQRLYRKGELHEFSDAQGLFRATIINVEPSGHLVLLDEQGKERRYAFKEVSYIVHAAG